MASKTSPGTLVDLGQFAFPGLKDRRVRVWQPKGYVHDRAHPVLVLFDGQNAFTDEGSFAGGWAAHRAADRLSRRGPAPLLVAVDHGHEERIDELSPYPTKFGTGRLPTLLELVASRVLPAVRSRWHLRNEPRDVLVAGSSMGGLAAVYSHLHRPEVFGGAVAMSPALWVGRGKILELALQVSMPWATRVYLDCGEREAGGRMVQATEALAAAFWSRGWNESQLFFRRDPRGHHAEASWKRRLPTALAFAFHGRKKA